MKALLSWRFLILISALLPLSILSCSAPDPAAAIRLPAVFADHMVVQRDMPVVVWGKASPGGQVNVSFSDAKVHVVVQSDSQWTAELPAFEAGGPHTLTVTGVDTLIFGDVLVGDVWICSGQSNMEWRVDNSNNTAEEISNANWEKIRIFEVANTVASKPQFDVTAKSWQPITPQNIGTFSAVGYFFGRKIHQEVNVPIGLVSTNWGGTRAEAWTSEKGLQVFPHFSEVANELSGFDKAEEYMSDEQAGYDSLFSAWEAQLFAGDEGMREGQPVYAAAELENEAWASMDVPVPWERAGLPGYDGIVWFRRSFDVPSWVTDKEMLLYLGTIDDIDETWINGVKVGESGQYNIDRIYQVGSDILKEGENSLTVRIIDTGGSGGFTGTEADMRLEVAGPSRAMPILLAGEWRYQTGAPEGQLPAPPSIPRIQDLPSVLYNGMIAPLLPMRIKGAIWYQGESNAGRAYEYRSLFQEMIKDWRDQWVQPDFPFFFVQLANYMTQQTLPEETSEWAELREAQLLALDLENTGMAVTIDIGEADDIHPRNKQDVGLRLAQSALAVAYGRDVVESGPLYKAMTVDGSIARLSFEYVGSGLEVRGEQLTGFVVAGTDSQFVWADAVLEGDDVLVSAPGVETPIAVRYGWADNPVVNLYNKEGLPASPFRTDEWPGVTWPK